jgi:hypothetical protein
MGLGFTKIGNEIFVYYKINIYNIMKNTIYISLGPDCTIAGLLNDLKFRTQSLPFDFLLTNPLLGIKYVTDLINNDFSDYLNDLKYNKQNKVYSTNYPNSLFYHHDLINNKQKLVKSLKIDHLNMDEPLIDKFKRRGDRFIEILTNKDNFNIFFYCIGHNVITIDFFQDLDNFIDVMNKKSNNQYLLIILFTDLQTDDDIKIDYSNQNICFYSFPNKDRIMLLSNIISKIV